MSWDFFNTRKVKTRKPHHCEQCWQTIPTGESCHYGSGVFDGEFFAYYEHVECRSAWQEVQAEALKDDNTAPFLHDEYDLPHFRDLLTRKHPVVAARLWPEASA